MSLVVLMISSLISHYLRCEVEAGTTIAFYNGSRADPQDFNPDTWETNNYRIFDPADMPHGTIDIPVWAQETKVINQSEYRRLLTNQNTSFRATVAVWHTSVTTASIPTHNLSCLTIQR